MNVSGVTNGGPAQAPVVETISTVTKQSDHVDRATRRVPTATAARYGPGGRRRFSLLLVRDCPYECGCAHAHRGEARGLRQAGCGRGQYAIMAVTA